MSKRNGKWGPFYSCSKYPRCNGSRKVPFGKKCNKCNGELYATIFNDQNILFCMNYPNCTHSEPLPDNFIANPEKLCLSNKIHSDIKKIIK
jgi:ssDNA-binding Zn-finger/Zn-ribbon topoisomerase 1